MNNVEINKCQNCHKDFVIEPEDFAFYAKIKVPPPTWCPECRLIRRMMFRDEKTLYRRFSDRTGKPIFSFFSSNVLFKVWDQKEWITDDWDPMDYGKDYDFNKPFFRQFKELALAVPWPSGSVQNLVRSDYCNNATNLKDCYLVFASTNAENSFYCTVLSNAKDCYDGSYLINCEISFEGFFNRKCYRSFFSSYCEESQDIFFCHNCIGVSNCFGCVGLRNKSYYIFNKPYSKEEYFQQLNDFNLSSFKNFTLLKDKFEQFRLQFPVKYMRGRHNFNVTGEYIDNSKNVFDSYLIDRGENLKFCFGLLYKPVKDSYDYLSWGNGGELIYETSVCGNNNYHLKFCYECFPNCKDLIYCMWCHSSSYLFGCIGLRNKQYCILNKQYTKEEYEKLVPKIIEHMNAKPYVSRIPNSQFPISKQIPNSKFKTREIVYRYGEFFPPELSPFAYNETISQEYFPLTKEQAIEQGYSWKDPEERDIKIDIKSEDLPDHIHPPKFCKAKLGRVKDVKDDIIGKVIECAHKGGCNEQCTTAFKIIEPELQFYRRMNLPLPRLCPNCRHYQRLKQRNPLKLWHRKCQCAGTQSENGVYKNTIKHFHGDQPCPNEFETTYAPERKEIVYCEKCYLAEVV